MLYYVQMVSIPHHAPARHSTKNHSSAIPSITPYRSVASSPHTLIKMDVAWMTMNRRWRAWYSAESDELDVELDIGEAEVVSCFLSFISG